MTDHAQAPAVTVVIVAYDSGAFLQACVDSLAGQTFEDFDVLIVDNASTDGSIAALRLPDARFKVLDAGANLGFAAANNMAAKQIGGEWMATLNPDTCAEPEWLERLMDGAARHPDAALFGSTQLRMDDPETLDGAGDVWFAAGVAWRSYEDRPRTMAPPEGESFSACGAAALHRLAEYRALGGMDEAFFCYHEDVDFAFRLRLAGGRCVQIPDAVVQHKGSGISGRTSDFTLFHGHRNRVWTYVKNTPGILFWLLLPAHVALNLFMLLQSHRAGQGRPLMRAYRAALAGIGPVWKQRREIQRARKASIGAVARAMVWDPRRLLSRT